MLSVNVSMLAKLATALIEGDDDIIAKLLERKLEDLGRDLILNVIGSEIAIANRVGEAIKTGGASEFNRMRQQWLHGLTPAPAPGFGFLRRVQNTYEREYALAERNAGRPAGKWWQWSRSRNEWLDRRWRHDWRTQPRDWHGRWIPGRLRHPYMSRTAKRIRRSRRRAARIAARTAIRIMEERR
jgi:hypothetical protein